MSKPAQEIAELWRKMFGEPPPITADAETLSRVLVKHMNAAPPYRPRPMSAGCKPPPTAASRKA